jgi:hypothetical protein
MDFIDTEGLLRQLNIQHRAALDSVKRKEIENALLHLSGYGKKLAQQLKTNKIDSKNQSSAKSLLADINSLMRKDALSIRTSEIDSYIDKIKKIIR